MGIIGLNREQIRNELASSSLGKPNKDKQRVNRVGPSVLTLRSQIIGRGLSSATCAQQIIQTPFEQSISLV